VSAGGGFRPADGIVWITGASSGIGRALALHLARRDFSVAASARDAKALADLAAEAAGAGGRILPLPLDVADRAGVAQAVARLERESGAIVTAILNAGTHRPVEAGRFAAEVFDQVFRVNLFGVVNCIAAVLPGMLSRRRGTLALVSSVAAYGGLPTAAAYGASKAAVSHLAASLKLDLDALGVRVVLISPGFVDTPLTRRNRFPMPFLISAERAAECIRRGLEGRAFEIAFPRRFALLLKALNLLPYGWYFAAVHRFTGR